MSWGIWYLTLNNEEKINKETAESNNTVNQKELTDIYMQWNIIHSLKKKEKRFLTMYVKFEVIMPGKLSQTRK